MQENQLNEDEEVVKCTGKSKNKGYKSNPQGKNGTALEKIFQVSYICSVFDAVLIDIDISWHFGSYLFGTQQFILHFIFQLQISCGIDGYLTVDIVFVQLQKNTKLPIGNEFLCCNGEVLVELDEALEETLTVLGGFGD